MGISRTTLAALALTACVAPADNAMDEPGDGDGDPGGALISNLASTGPVSGSAMADPGVVLYNNKFYAFFTGGGLHEATAPTAGGPWTSPSNVLDTSNLPVWIDLSKGVWAPDMIEAANGDYVVYFAAALDHSAGTPTGSDAPASGARCIGSARSSSPTGPFVADAQPVVCLPGYHASDDMSLDPGDRMRGQGVIDPSPARVNISGSTELFLVYKTQGPSPSTIRLVRLSYQDGKTVLGDSHQLLRSLGNTFNDTIEGPSLVQNGSWFVLFVAHGNWDSCGYSTQWYKSQHIWAWSNSPTPLLTSSNTGLCGPGGADVTGSQVPGQARIFFHGWVKDGRPSPPGGGASRDMYAAVLRFANDGYTPIVGERL
jgi:hypothetical protein